MTTPKVNTIKREDARFYVEPESGEKVPGVTSVLNMLPKSFLRYWAAKEVASTAVEELGTVVSMVLRDPQAAIDHLKKAPDRNTRKAADIGTAAHDIFERMSRGEDVGRVHPDLEIYRSHFSDFLDTVQPEYHHMEETVWSDSRGPDLSYAGSFDAFATIQGEKCWVDNKTTRSGIHAEVGLQLSAYGHADHLIRPDGSRIPLPKGNAGVVLHVRPEGWKLVPVRYDQESFDYFLHLREVFNYEKTFSKTIVGKPVFSGPGDVVASGPKRRAPRAARVTPAVTA